MGYAEFQMNGEQMESSVSIPETSQVRVTSADDAFINLALAPDRRSVVRKGVRLTVSALLGSVGLQAFRPMTALGFSHINCSWCGPSPYCGDICCNQPAAGCNPSVCSDSGYTWYSCYFVCSTTRVRLKCHDCLKPSRCYCFEYTSGCGGCSC